MPTYASRSLWTSAAAPTFDAATLAWVAAVIANGGTVSGAREQLVDDLIVGLKDDGVWTKLDRLWLFAAENQAAAQVDLVANGIVTENSSPSFTTDRGYLGNGTTSYVDSNYNPSTGGVNFVQNSASLGVWVNDSRASQVNNKAVAIEGGSASYIGPNQAFGSGGFTWALNDAGPHQTPSVANAQGFSFVSRTGSNVCTAYKNGSSVDSHVTGSATVASLEFYICADNQGAPAEFNGVDTISCTVMGGGLTGTEAGNLYSRLRTYQTAVGVP